MCRALCLWHSRSDESIRELVPSPSGRGKSCPGIYSEPVEEANIDKARPSVRPLFFYFFPAPFLSIAADGCNCSGAVNDLLNDGSICFTHETCRYVSCFRPIVLTAPLFRESYALLCKEDFPKGKSEIINNINGMERLTPRA